MLNRDAAAHSRDAIDIARADRLGMIDDPVKAIERHLAIYPLKNIEEAGDGLIVRSMDPEWPPVLGKVLSNRVELILHVQRKVRSGFSKILEVGGGKH
jgi:hypothetical protein